MKLRSRGANDKMNRSPFLDRLWLKPMLGKRVTRRRRFISRIWRAKVYRFVR